jgi:hypothetical protein
MGFAVAVGQKKRQILISAVPDAVVSSLACRDFSARPRHEIAERLAPFRIIEGKASRERFGGDGWNQGFRQQK